MGPGFLADCVTQDPPHSTPKRPRCPARSAAAQRRPKAAQGAHGARSGPRRPSALRSGHGARQRPRCPAAARSGPRRPAAARSGPAAPRRRFRCRRRFGGISCRRCRRCHPATPGSVGTLPPGPRFRPPTSPRARRWQPKAPSCPKSGQRLPKKWAATAVAQTRSSCPKSGQSRHRLSSEPGARQAGGAQPSPGTPGGRGCRQPLTAAARTPLRPGRRCHQIYCATVVILRFSIAPTPPAPKVATIAQQENRVISRS